MGCLLGRRVSSGLPLWRGSLRNQRKGGIFGRSGNLCMPKARTFNRVCIVAFEGCGVVGSGEVDRVGRLAADLAKWVFRTPLGPVGDQGRRKTG